MLSLSRTSTRRMLGLAALAGSFMGGIVVLGYLGFLFYLDELYPSPPPEQAPDVPAPVAAQSERLVIVVLDAVREDAMNDPTVMPHVVRIAEHGRTGVAITQPVTMTLLSVLNFGTGQTPGLGWSVHNFEAESFRDESVFYWAHAKGLRVAFTGDAGWAQLFGRYAVAEKVFADEGMYAESSGLLSDHDLEALAEARRLLAEPESYQVVVYHLTSTDHAGHKHGGLSRDAQGRFTGYGEVVNAADAVVGALFDEFYRDGDTWLITADHGMTDDGSHGGGDAVTRRAPFVLLGAGVRLGEPAEISLNSWAATFSVLLGLPTPRTAEQAAAFELLTLSDEQRLAALEGHAMRRREFVDGVRLALGVDDGLHWRANNDDPGAAIAEANAFLNEVRLHRRWLYGLGLGVGVLMHLALGLLALWAWPPREEQPARRYRWLAFAALITAWLLLVSVPLAFDHWLFRIVAVLGQASESWWNVGRALLYLVGLSAVVLGLRAWLSRRGGVWGSWLRESASWLFFALSVLATSQIVIKWPYGPLTQAYLALFGWLLALWALWCLRRRQWLGRWLLAAVSLAGLVSLAVLTERVNLQMLAETSLSERMAFGLAGGAGLWLVGGIARRETSEPTRWLVILGGVILAGVAVAYRLDPEPMVARLAVGTWALSFVGSCALSLTPRSRRDLLFVFALLLAHIMSSDWMVLATLAQLGILASLSGTGLAAKRGFVPLAVALVGLLDIGFFNTSGYRFEFPEIDVRVVFMFDRSSIDLGAGFVLLALQHSVVWLALWASVFYDRKVAGDERSLRMVFVAVLAIFVLRTWGPFFSIEFKLENHWFVSHAIPMFILSMVECAIAVVWYALVAASQREKAAVLAVPASAPLESAAAP